MKPKMINIPFEDYREMVIDYGRVVFINDEIDENTVTRMSKLGNVYRMNIDEDRCLVRIEYDSYM